MQAEIARTLKVPAWSRRIACSTRRPPGIRRAGGPFVVIPGREAGQLALQRCGPAGARSIFHCGVPRAAPSGSAWHRRPLPVVGSEGVLLFHASRAGGRAPLTTRPRCRRSARSVRRLGGPCRRPPGGRSGDAVDVAGFLDPFWPLPGPRAVRLGGFRLSSSGAQFTPSSRQRYGSEIPSRPHRSGSATILGTHNMRLAATPRALFLPRGGLPAGTARPRARERGELGYRMDFGWERQLIRTI